MSDSPSHNQQVQDCHAPQPPLNCQPRENERFLHTLITSLPGIVYRCKNDPDWTLEYISDQVQGLVGYPPADFLSRQVAWGQLIEPDDRDRVWKEVQSAITAHQPYYLEYRMRSRAGDQIWAWERGQAVYGPDGTVRALEGFIMDITERKQVEQEARRQAQLLESFWKFAPASFVILDRDFNFIRVNDTYAKACGREVSEFPGHNHFEFYPSDTQAIFEQVRATKTPFQILARPFVFPDHPEWGTTYWDWSLVPILDATGKVELFVFSLNDVTERKRAEEALRTSEERLRRVLDALPVAAYTCDDQGLIAYFNERATELWGRAPQLNHPEDRFCGSFRLYLPDGSPIPHDRCWMAVALREGQTVNGKEAVIERPDGTRRSALAHANPLWDSSGRVIGAVNVLLDITERKQAEAELAEREQLLRVMQETGPACVKRVSPDGALLYMNSAGLAFIEADSLHEAIGLSVFDLVTREHRKGFEDMHRAVIGGGTRSLRFEIIGLKGTPRWMETYAVPFRNPITGLVEHLAVSHDITERKRAEEAAAQARRRYEDLVNTVNGIVWEVDVRTMTFTFVSHQAEKMLGYPVEQWLTVPNFWVDHIHPEDRQWAPAFCLEETRKKSGHTFEYRMLAADGRTVWLRDIVSVIVEDDLPVTLRGVMVDITERRLTEEAERNRAVRKRMQDDALIELAKNRVNHEGDLEAAFQAITETAARLLGVGRASVWLLDPDRSAIRLADLYEMDRNRHSAGTILWARDFPTYFQMITSDARTVTAHDAHTDPRTKEFSASYLTPLGIGAMLDAPIRLKGETGGVLCHEHLGGPRIWTSDEDSVAASLATLVSLALEAHERKQAEQALQASEERFRTFTQYFPGPAFIKNAKGQHLFVNPAFEEALNLSRSDWEGKTNDELFPSHIAADINRHDQQILRDGKSLQVIEQTEQNGERRQWLVTKFLISDGQRHPALLGGIALDVTERKQLEQRLRQAEKMEALGTLAGGIAHDFNNILAAMIGYTELAQDGVTAGSRAGRNLDQVLVAGRRAKALIQQILAFSRQREPQREVLDLGTLLQEAMTLLRASIPATIAMRVDVRSSDSTVLADPTQLQQVIMNVCSNAAQAMQERGGTLGLHLEEVDVPPSFASMHPPLRAGAHMRLTITDTGVGMTPEVLARIFDPFFTTKKVGEGTGLGLSASLGIVTSHGGTISVESEPGRGSTFSIYLPKLTAATDSSQGPEADRRGGSERILFVDDETALVRLADQTLGNLGYRVTVLTDPVLALGQFRSEPDAFDLVITDQTMPGMTGEVLARELLRLRPSLPIILCTGFSEGMSEQAARKVGFRGLLMKPLTVAELDQAIHNALQRSTR